MTATLKDVFLRTSVREECKNKTPNELSVVSGGSLVDLPLF
jgi:hypothetical protein